MDQLTRFLSGGVPGGFWPYFAATLILLFVYFFVMRYSEVVHKKNFRKVIFGIIGLIYITYIPVRLARPPKPTNVYVGILPLQWARVSLDSTEIRSQSEWSGAGWGLSEMTVAIGEKVSPGHLHFLRPEWLTQSIDSITDEISSDTGKLFTWARLVKLDYLVSGTFDIEKTQIRARYVLWDTHQEIKLREFEERLNKDSFPADIEKISKALATEIFTVADEDADWKKNEGNDYKSGRISSYFWGRSLLASNRVDSALAVFQMTLKADSTSPLGWLGTGLAYGEKMIAEKNEKDREIFRKRFELHLKRSSQLSEQFELPLINLAWYYCFIKPEPRYLDAEFAMLAANGLYGRDYQVYHILSFMQKMRWESFGMPSKEAILLRALEINPAGFETYLELGREYMSRSRGNDIWIRKALEQYQIAIKMKPKDWRAILSLAQAADLMGSYDYAIDLLIRAQRIFPDKADVYYNLGIMYQHKAEVFKQKRQFKEETEQNIKAEANFIKTVEINNSAYAHLYLGYIYDRMNKREDAIREFRLVMKLLSPKDPYREEARKKLREYFPDVEG